MAYSIGTACNGCGFCVQWCPTKAIQGRRKQAHTILAERCIECGACGRICAQRAVTDSAGKIQERIRLAEWPKPQWTYSSCDGCGICVDACPTRSIRMESSLVEAGIFAAVRPLLDNPKMCVSCGFCQRDCPTGAVVMV